MPCWLFWRRGTLRFVTSYCRSRRSGVRASCGAQVLQVTVSQCWIWHVLLSWSGEGLDGPSKTQETVEIFPPLVVADFEWLDQRIAAPSVISDELRAQLAIHHVNAISIVSSGIVIE